MWPYLRCLFSVGSLFQINSPRTWLMAVAVPTQTLTCPTRENGYSAKNRLVDCDRHDTLHYPHYSHCGFGPRIFTRVKYIALRNKHHDRDSISRAIRDARGCDGTSLPLCSKFNLCLPNTITARWQFRKIYVPHWLVLFSFRHLIQGTFSSSFR